ncbi:phosphotransferase enzyme family protein [Dyadobacter psychrophilus]|uniref:Ser/Thr protein kinase RdoA involved in Cpx stress response, MazF antagonist n=1 Tax=Dyadobacter psychrophilus TaxID=651661 RepID=A0A1T5DR44_9BACT|nr:phosphotransferase [Dyadobacter psychrophilus]SKB74257.1 Ser/Thr protein kinase RdoA involved in Cpx stress response, MazF antagonist [Dyadobacter psychrophilus]
MTHFPVTSSNLSISHLAEFLKAKYFPNAVVTCRLLKAGISHTYLVNASGSRHIFRIYTFGWRSETEINEELRLLLHLKQNGIPVSYPVTDEEGRYIQSFNAPEGDRLGVMFSYAEGEKQLNFSPDMHFKIGAIMAQMHVLTKDFFLERVTYTSKTILIDPLEQISKFLAADAEEMAFLSDAKDFLLQEFANADESQLRKGAVHLDIWFDNLNIDKHNQVTIFDFDFCGNGWLCLDLAYYILQLHSVEKDEQECSSKLRKFIDGYESVTAISREEKRIIPMLGVSLYFFYLGIQSQRFDNFSNVFFNDVYLKRFINILVRKYLETAKNMQL